MTQHRYGNWTIELHKKPAPFRCLDWEYVHDDYAGDLTTPPLSGYARSLEESKAEIDEIELDIAESGLKYLEDRNDHT